MYLASTSKRKIVLVITNVMLAVFVISFVFHTVVGPSGLFRLAKVKRQVAAAKKQLSMLEQQNKHTTKKIRALTEGTVDVDFLDEEVRKSLGYIGVNETFLNTE